MDITETFKSTDELVAAAHAFITRDEAQIRFVNLRYTLYNERESRWFYHVDFKIDDGHLKVWDCDTGDVVLRLPTERLHRLKIRPYYYAACVGFKNLVFVVEDNNDTEVQYESQRT